ncbi:MAG TPA: serine hydrolase domain-containing protein [Candidatus Brocadiia bacterium]|nr:serine hydrolase domain-containing protein [Candidatus Brocadiia bacterium]
MPVITLLSFCMAALVMAVSAEPSAPAAIPAELQNTINSLASELMKQFKVPGISIAVVWDRELAWHAEFGVKSADKPDPVTQETVFEAASMTKLLATYAALKLAEQGRLNLDMPLWEYLGEPYIPGDEDHKLITARMVMTHVTGLPNWREGGWNTGAPLKLIFKPGEKYGYSGEGYLFFQRAMEKITGEGLDPYLKRTLMRPAGMSSSSLVWEERYAELAAAGHGGRGQVQADKPRYREANAAFSLFCAPCDYARFIVEILKTDRSGSHSLSASTIEEMLKPRLKFKEGESGVAEFRGLGWVVTPLESGNRISHGGSNGSGFQCWSEFYPHNGRGIVIMTNSGRGSEVYRKLLEEARGIMKGMK